MVSLVFDASTIISLSETCLIKLLEELAKKAELIIPESVYREAVLNPLKIKRFELNAVRIKKAVEDGWIKVVYSDKGVLDLTQKIEELSNNLLLLNRKSLRIIHRGEAETLALMNILKASVLVIDERTTRLLVESPERLREYISSKYRQEVILDVEKLKEFQNLIGDFKIIRSVDLIALGFDQGMLKGELENTKEALEASLFAARYSGCAVKFSEIEDYLKSV